MKWRYERKLERTSLDGATMSTDASRIEKGRMMTMNGHNHRMSKGGGWRPGSRADENVLIWL